MFIDLGLAIALGSLSILMAVVGGLVATQRKSVRVSFVVMGGLSVVLVIFQAVRATRSQAAFAKQQTDLQGLTTGGGAYPSLRSDSFLGPSGNPSGDATFYLENHNKTNSLYSVKVESVGYANHGERYCNNIEAGEIPLIPEIPPGGEAKIGDFSFKDPIERYELDVRARNGSFVISARWTGKNWIMTTKREGSDTVLEEMQQPAGYTNRE